MPDPETLHAFLKVSSMARHDRTEATMGGVGWSSEREYIAFLRIQASGTGAIEQALSTYGDDFERAGIHWTSRAAAAANDLQALGNIPPAPPPLAFATFDGALGAAYTLEGSRLGNAMLFRQLQTDNPRLAKQASAFLGYPTTPGFWREFMDTVNAAAPERERWPAILAGSIQAFDVFQTCAEEELKQMARPMAAD